MKKIILIFILLLSACSQPSYDLITPVKLDEKIVNKDSFVLVLGNSRNCEPCVRYNEVALEKFSKENSVHLLNIDEIKEQAEMDLLIKVLKETLLVSAEKPIATPSTYFIKDGELTFFENGPLIEDQLKEFHNKHVKGGD